MILEIFIWCSCMKIRVIIDLLNLVMFLEILIVDNKNLYLYVVCVFLILN